MSPLYKTSILIPALLILPCLYYGSAMAAEQTKPKIPAAKIQSTTTARSAPKASAVASAPAVEQDVELEEVTRIAASGAPGLALRMADRVQGGIEPQQVRWINWERQRLQILVVSQAWDDIVRRVKKLPANLAPEFSRWASTQMAEALLQLGQGRQARQELQRLILSSSGMDDQATLGWIQQWRRLIIHSYISEGITEDALTAILRFQQDYTLDPKEILLLRARVLLMNQRAAEAAELLAAYTDDPTAGMLLLLAQLRSEARSPVKVLQAALRHLRAEKHDRVTSAALWSVVAEAAQRAGDRGSAVDALEQVVASSKQLPADKLFSFDADSLWNAYLDYALYAGNQAQLLIGQDEAWFKYTETSAAKFPVRQRAMYALLMLRGNTPENRLEAAGLFIKSLQLRKNNSHIIQQLFTTSRFFPATSDIPEPARRALVDIALAKQDIPLASQIMATLKAPPKGETSYMWHLRRARLLILGGQPAAGVTALQAFVQEHPTATRTQIDRFLQVVFDLQTVGQHDAAYQLFAAVIQASKDKKLQRELYFWMADSRNAQARYADAAELYLKSAMLLDGKGWDPWGQTAHYQAAKSLGKAGLLADAYFIYQKLLRVTKEEDRRAVLRYEVQKLQLAKSDEQDSGETPATEETAVKE